MKKEQYILDTQESEQALTMIKSYLKPRELNHLTIGKKKIEGETCCAVTFGMFLNEKEYNRLKKFAKSVDVFKAAEDDFCEETLDDRVVEALKKRLEESGAVQCVVIKHDGEAR